MEHSLVAFRYVALSNDPAKELPAAKFHHELSDLLLNDRRNIAVEMFRAIRSSVLTTDALGAMFSTNGYTLMS